MISFQQSCSATNVCRGVPSLTHDLASISPRTAKVVQAYKDYTAVMEKVGVPYRYS